MFSLAFLFIEKKRITGNYKFDFFINFSTGSRTQASLIMAFAQPTKKGSWLEEKILGSGGFGQVVLWKNEVKLPYY